MECKMEKNNPYCNCTYEPCERKNKCCIVFIITGKITSFRHAFLLRNRNAHTTAQSVIL